MAFFNSSNNNLNSKLLSYRDKGIKPKHKLISRYSKISLSNLIYFRILQMPRTHKMISNNSHNSYNSHNSNNSHYLSHNSKTRHKRYLRRTINIIKLTNPYSKEASK